VLAIEHVDGRADANSGVAIRERCDSRVDK